MAGETLREFHNLLYELLIVLKTPDLGEDGMDVAVEIVAEMGKRLQAHPNYHGQQEHELEDARRRIEQKIERQREISKLRRAQQEINNRLQSLLDPHVDFRSSLEGGGGEDPAVSEVNRKRAVGSMEIDGPDTAEARSTKKLKEAEVSIKTEWPHSEIFAVPFTAQADCVKVEQVKKDTEQFEVHGYACGNRWKRANSGLMCPCCKSDFTMVVSRIFLTTSHD